MLILSFVLCLSLHDEMQQLWFTKCQLKTLLRIVFFWCCLFFRVQKTFCKRKKLKNHLKCFKNKRKFRWNTWQLQMKITYNSKLAFILLLLLYRKIIHFCLLEWYCHTENTSFIKSPMLFFPLIIKRILQRDCNTVYCHQLTSQLDQHHYFENGKNTSMWKTQ